MRKRTIIISLVLIAAVAVGCAEEKTQRARDKDFDPASAWQLVRDGALLVDVRSPSEYARGHLDGAINVPHVQVRDRAEAFGDDADRPIVVYCAVGGRSSVAKRDLEAMGYKHVVNAGGYDQLLRAK